jgi:toxin ParE1/3/4
VVKLTWSPRSVGDLAEICEYIGRDSAHYSRLFAQRVITAVESLAQFPDLGRIVPEYQRPDLRELIFQNYRIVYRVRTDSVEIAAVVHGARLLPEVLRSRDS